MTTTTSATTGSRWRTITLGALLGLVALFLFQQVAIFGAWSPPVGLIQAAGTAVVALVVRSQWRWGPAVAVGWGVLLVVGSLPMIIADLADPAAVTDFVFTLVALALITTVVVAGVAAARTGTRPS
jgi:hypothetical protein